MILSSSRRRFQCQSLVFRRPQWRSGIESGCCGSGVVKPMAICDGCEIDGLKHRES